MNNLFKQDKTFCIITGKEYAQECLQKAYKYGYQFASHKTVKDIPFDMFFAEYPETNKKPSRLAFRFEPSMHDIGWAHDTYYIDNRYKVYEWANLADSFIHDDLDLTNFLDLL